MMNRERMARNRMTRSGATTLGLDERLERSLAYLFGWVSGLILFLFERNRNVRWHAMQSMAVFGPLSILVFLLNLIKGLLHLIPVLSVVTDFGLGLLITVIWFVIIGLGIWLIIMAWFRPNYRLPFVSDWISKWA